MNRRTCSAAATCLALLLPSLAAETSKARESDPAAPAAVGSAHSAQPNRAALLPTDAELAGIVSNRG